MQKAHVVDAMLANMSNSMLFTKTNMELIIENCDDINANSFQFLMENRAAFEQSYGLTYVKKRINLARNLSVKRAVEGNSIYTEQQTKQSIERYWPGTSSALISGAKLRKGFNAHNAQTYLNQAKSLLNTQQLADAKLASGIAKNLWLHYQTEEALMLAEQFAKLSSDLQYKEEYFHTYLTILHANKRAEEVDAALPQYTALLISEGKTVPSRDQMLLELDQNALQLKNEAALAYQNDLQIQNAIYNHNNKIRQRLAEIEAERKERERLARLEAERKEKERLARLEAERLERERLAKLEAERKERERLAKLEAERLEKERLAKLEAERLEKERLAKLEAERLEKERLAKLEAERLERERLAKLEAERLEKERLAKLEAERLEKERLAKLEGRKIGKRKASQNRGRTVGKRKTGQIRSGKKGERKAGQAGKRAVGKTGSRAIGKGTTG